MFIGKWLPTLSTLNEAYLGRYGVKKISTTWASYEYYFFILPKSCHWKAIQSFFAFYIMTAHERTNERTNECMKERKKLIYCLFLSYNDTMLTGLDHGALNYKEMNNRISLIVKHVWNVGMHVLHSFKFGHTHNCLPLGQIWAFIFFY